MKGLDLSKFQKVSEDKDTVIMKHPKGHTITIAMKALPKLHQEQFKRLKMADGGDVKPSPSPTPTPQGPMIDKQAATDVQEGFKKALGFDDGGNVPEDGKDTSGQPAANITINTSPAQGPSQQSPQPVPVQMPQLPQSPNPLLANGSMNAPAAAQAGVQGAQLGQQIESAKAQALVPQEQQYLNTTNQLNQNYTNNINELKQHANDLAEFTKENPINEKSYLENMGAGKKMGTALGLLFSGAGSGLTGGPNLAYEFLNKQIDRNIQSQKDRYGQHQTVWGAYKDLYNDEGVADNMARAHALDMLSHQAAQTAAQLGTPAAARSYLDLISKITPERNKAILDSAGSMNSIPMNVPHGTPSGGPSNLQPVNAPGNSNDSSQNDEGQNIDYKILKPGASEDVAQMIKYNPTIPESDKTKISNQMTQASQAEKSLGDIQNTFEHLVAGSRTSGWSGRIHRTMNPHVLAGIGAGVGTAVAPGIGTGVGGAIGEGIGQGANMLTNTAQNRQFDSDKSRLLSYVSSAVPGRGSELIEDLVNKNTPEYGDDTATLRRKLGAIKEFIMNHTETDALKRHGLSYK